MLNDNNEKIKTSQLNELVKSADSLSQERKQEILSGALLPKFPKFSLSSANVTPRSKQLRFGYTPSYVQKNMEQAVQRYEDEMAEKQITSEKYKKQFEDIVARERAQDENKLQRKLEQQKKLRQLLDQQRTESKEMEERAEKQKKGEGQ